MKNKLTPEDKKILKLLGYVKTQEDGAQLEHPSMCDFATFPQYVWKGDTLEDVLKNFTAGIKYSAIAAAADSLNTINDEVKRRARYGTNKHILTPQLFKTCL
jgi:hypothetical protein